MPEQSRSRGLFRPTDWLTGDPGPAACAVKHVDESLLCFFTRVSLSWSLAEGVLDIT
jgi:hypothetical protein